MNQSGKSERMDVLMFQVPTKVTGAYDLNNVACSLGTGSQKSLEATRQFEMMSGTGVQNRGGSSGGRQNQSVASSQSGQVSSGSRQSQSMPSGSRQSQSGQVGQAIPSSSRSGGTGVVQGRKRPVTSTGLRMQKGQRQNLSQLNPQLNQLEISVGWDLSQAVGYDLDIDAFLLGGNRKVLGDEWFVFYGSTTSPDGSCCYLGECQNKTGDDRIMAVTLSKVSGQVEKISFVITIHEGLERRQSFSQVKDVYVRISDVSTKKDLVFFPIEDTGNVTALNVGDLYLKDGSWRFQAVGAGLNTDLAGLCGFFGVNIE